MNENQPPWTSEEKITVFAAVEQCRAAGGPLDWRAIAATVPGRSARSRARASTTLHLSPRPPASCGVRVCGAAARLIPWIGGTGSAVRATNRSLRSPPDLTGDFAGEIRRRSQRCSLHELQGIPLDQGIKRAAVPQVQTPQDALPGAAPVVLRVHGFCAAPSSGGDRAADARAVRKLHPVSPPASVLRRPCLRCRRPFDSLDRKPGTGSRSCSVQRTDRCDRRLISPAISPQHRQRRH